MSESATCGYLVVAAGGYRRGTMPRLTLKLLPILLLPFAAAGCVSTDDQRAMDAEKCNSFGFQPGTDGFATCMMRQDAQRTADEQRSLDRMEAQERRDRDRQASQRSDDIDTRPSFDRDGNPNFDPDGNYIGCHGIGCEVDNPDDDTDG
ncbi:hypothetical protein [Neoaquamicrobium sediminum]